MGIKPYSGPSSWINPVVEKSTTQKPIYKRVVLKLTGEALKHSRKILIYDEESAIEISREILSIHNIGTEIILVLGGGNIIRGRQLEYINKPVADRIGMMATIMNGLYLQNILEQQGTEVRVQSSIGINNFAEPFIPRKVISHLEKKRIVILVGGTGNPYFSTDQAAVLRALELDANAIIKGTKIDGLYKNFPPNKDEQPIDHISYKRIREVNFGTLFDNTALELLLDQEKKIPLHIINIFKKENLLKVICGKKVGSKIS